MVKKMQFTKIEKLLAEKTRINRELLALRVQQMRILRKNVTNKNVIRYMDQVETAISSVSYDYEAVSDILDIIESHLDVL